jgi:hypothetical protein
MKHEQLAKAIALIIAIALVSYIVFSNISGW